MTEHFGPVTPVAQEVHALKYRGEGESFKEAMTRVADALKDGSDHFHLFRDALLHQRFLPAGRVQAAMGAPLATTPYNCYVSGTIGDSMDDIFDKLKEAALTLKAGGGIGYDFSSLRPRNAKIVSLNSYSSGPISFMDVYNAMCGTIASAGHRRGAQMGILRVDHPDIEEFITAKNNETRLTNFNVSVAVTDEFMKAVRENKPFALRFNGQTYSMVDANALWNKIMRSTWTWAEPGVVFIDTMNKKNNLWYCERIAATNPCGEQPLPPYGACLLGSFNLTKYIVPKEQDGWEFDYDQLLADIPVVVRAMDNVVDRARYPLSKQEQEAKNKRRMGLGVTGLANTVEILGLAYGSDAAKAWTGQLMQEIVYHVYLSSIELAKEKGPFPLFDERLLSSGFALSLPDDLRDLIRLHGLRNSHLLSIAPTGTISVSADSVSSGLEPPYALSYTRKIHFEGGQREEEVKDYAYQFYGVRGKTSMDLTAKEHVDMLCLMSQYVDSACSKTCNVGRDVTFEEFKDLYMLAWEGGASGCTTYREPAEGEEGRVGILKANVDEEVAEDNAPILTGSKCEYDPITQVRTCE